MRTNRVNFGVFVILFSVFYILGALLIKQLLLHIRRKLMEKLLNRQPLDNKVSKGKHFIEEA